MSEYLKNRDYKKGVLKRLINDLHQGRDFKEVKAEFNKFVEGVDGAEIADIEQQLIREGMDPQEITKLCDVHAALVRDALEKNEKMELVPGHPLYSLQHENGAARLELEELSNLLEQIKKSANGNKPDLVENFQEKLASFRENMDKHYSKKENLFFPYLEKHNITGPPSVMWSVDDEIRDLLKETITITGEFMADTHQLSELEDVYFRTRDKINEMFYKEEEILTPMLTDELTEDEWAIIKKGEKEFGIVFSPPEADIWQPAENITGEEKVQNYQTGEALQLETGSLTPVEINEILKNLPLDITFVGSDNDVRYFSQTEDRVFARTESIIGRKVQNCHPPESVHIVNKIVDDFKTGRENRAEFWLELGGHFIYIQYLALRDAEGTYLGTVEITQDLTKARKLEGERRLLKYGEV